MRRIVLAASWTAGTGSTRASRGKVQQLRKPIPHGPGDSGLTVGEERVVNHMSRPSQ